MNLIIWITTECQWEKYVLLAADALLLACLYYREWKWKRQFPYADICICHGLGLRRRTVLTKEEADELRAEVDRMQQSC